MRGWMSKFGKQYQNPTPGKPNYLGSLPNQPFPLNPAFRSQPVLSEALREEIWKQIIVDGKSVKEVSARFSVDMRRVSAVVRLMEVERDWKLKVSPASLLCSRRRIGYMMIPPREYSIGLEDSNKHGYQLGLPKHL